MVEQRFSRYGQAPAPLSTLDASPDRDDQRTLYLNTQRLKQQTEILTLRGLLSAQ